MVFELMVYLHALGYNMIFNLLKILTRKGCREVVDFFRQIFMIRYSIVYLIYAKTSFITSNKPVSVTNFFGQQKGSCLLVCNAMLAKVASALFTIAFDFKLSSCFLTTKKHGI